MIDFYYWPTPNGWKISIMLEECGLAYRMVPVNIGRGDQFKPEFLAISPNNRMPAIVDHDAAGGPVSVFESGAILLHLAARAGRFMPSDEQGRKEAMEWLFWQVGNLGPMAGQLSHFVNYAVGEHPYSKQRYAAEYKRCLGVLERRLEGRDFILDVLLGRRHCVLALGPDRRSAGTVAGRISKCRALAPGHQGAAGGAGWGRPRPRVAPVRAADR